MYGPSGTGPGAPWGQGGAQNRGLWFQRGVMGPILRLPYPDPITLFLAYRLWWPLAGPICGLFEPPHGATAELGADDACAPTQALPLCHYEVGTNNPQMRPA